MTVGIPIKTIRRDFQESECLFDEKVWEIAEAMLRGDAVPPVVVRFDGENYLLQDGFHRVEAALSIGHQEIDAEVIPGTLADMQAEFEQMVRENRGKW